MSTVRLVRVIRDDPTYKGTWYRIGQQHFVEQYPDWPLVMACRWRALTTDVCGGINESDCIVLQGPLAWLRCQWFRLTYRRPSYQT